ncbi:hypothetical protein FHW00_004768 [Ochrobactrum sp. P6BSIII]|nr:hypothetical protein [Ochrobactrum sp. P6BSIII]
MCSTPARLPFTTRLLCSILLVGWSIYALIVETLLPVN